MAVTKNLFNFVIFRHNPAVQYTPVTPFRLAHEHLATLLKPVLGFVFS